MLSKWKVRTVEVAGSTFFQAYRDTDAASKKNRMETKGGYWSTEKEALDFAATLNREDKE